MTFSLRIYREHGAFTASAICRQGVVSVEMRGRLVTAITSEIRAIPVHASPLSRSLPTSSLPGYIAEGLRRLSPVARPRHFLIVVESLRGLASVFLLRLSQPLRTTSRDEEPRLIQTLVSGLYRAIEPAKQSRCGLGQRLQQSSPFDAVSYVTNMTQESVNGVPKVWERGTHECS